MSLRDASARLSSPAAATPDSAAPCRWTMGKVPKRLLRRKGMLYMFEPVRDNYELASPQAWLEYPEDKLTICLDSTGLPHRWATLQHI